GAGGEALVELGGRDVDAFAVWLTAEHDRQRHDADLVALPEVGRQLGVRVGDEPDHCSSGSASRASSPAATVGKAAVAAVSFSASFAAAARNLYMIIADPISAKRNRPADGSGPHRFGRSNAHQIAAATIQMTAATCVPMSARRDLSALAPATPRAIGKDARTPATPP